jgi:hypothetical protein
MITINGGLQDWVMSDVLSSQRNQKAMKHFKRRQKAQEEELKRKIDETAKNR